MSLFDRLTPERISGHIMSASEIVVFSSCSLTEKIAEALVETGERIGFERVIVLIDTSEDVLRKGYGEVDGVKTLLGHPDMILREADGLRINTLICDQSAWVFNLPPMTVEDQNTPEGGFNAMFLSSQQRQQVLEAINPAYNNLELEPSDIGCAISDVMPTIGANDVCEEKLMDMVARVEKNPPQSFDLTRLVNVYQSKIEFVELELKGTKINQHRIQLPVELKKLMAKDPETQKRINASYQIIDGQSEISGEALNEQITSLRKIYLRNLKGLGVVLLKEQRQHFQEDIAELENAKEDFRIDLESKVDAEITKNIQSISEVFGKLILEQKPKYFTCRISGELTLDIAKKQVEELLQKAAPSAAKLSENVKLRCNYKDVTIEMLRDEEFQKQVREAFPHVEWEMPFDEQVAAPAQK